MPESRAGLFRQEALASHARSTKEGDVLRVRRGADPWSPGLAVLLAVTGGLFVMYGRCPAWASGPAVIGPRAAGARLPVVVELPGSMREQVREGGTLCLVVPGRPGPCEPVAISGVEPLPRGDLVRVRAWLPSTALAGADAPAGQALDTTAWLRTGNEPVARVLARWLSP